MVILLDTGFLYAFFNLNDVHHREVKEKYRQILDGKFGQPILLDYVFDELMTLIQTRTKSNLHASKIGELILSDIGKTLVQINTNEENFRAAWKLFAYQKERGFLSFTDAMIIAVAEFLPAKYVATLDGRMRAFVTVISNE